MRVWSSNRGKYYCAMKVVMKVGMSQVGELGEEGVMLRQHNEEEAIYEGVKSYCKSKKMTYYI